MKDESSESDVSERHFPKIFRKLEMKIIEAPVIESQPASALAPMNQMVDRIAPLPKRPGCKTKVKAD